MQCCKLDYCYEPLISFLSHLLKQEDIGVQVSVRSSVHPFVRSSDSSTFNMGIL